MSKSDISEASRINLTDEKDTIMKKIQKAKTDPQPIPETEKELEGRFEAINLLNIYSAFSEKEFNVVLQSYAGKGFSEFKKDLTEIIIENINPISTEMKKLLNNKDQIEEILKKVRLKQKKFLTLLLVI